MDPDSLASQLTPEELVPLLPYPLAMALQTLLADAERRECGAHLPQFPFQLTAVMGLLVRLTAVIAIQSYVQLANASDARINQRVVTALRAPTDGTWLEVAVALLDRVAGRDDAPLAQRTAAALRNKSGAPRAGTVIVVLRKLIAYRNRLLHGETVSAADTSRAYDLLLTAVQGYGFLASYTMLANHNDQVWQLTGALPYLSSADIDRNRLKLPDSAPCLCHRDNDEAPLSLAPLLVFRPGDAESPVTFDELFFLNAGVAERLDYIAYRYTRQVEGRALGTYDAFRSFLQRLPAPVLARDPKIDFNDLVAYHDRLFVGRLAVQDEIASFIATRPASYGTLSAQGGMGKTAIMARLYSRHGVKKSGETRLGDRWAFHFCMPLEDRDNAVVALRSLIAQVCEQTELSAVAYLSNDFESLRERFAQLLADTSALLAAGERLVLVIDALDESLAASHGQYLPKAFPAELPESVVMLISYRVGADGVNALVERSLSHIPKASRYALSTASPLAGLTRDDVCAYLGLTAPGVAIPEATVDAICTAAQRDGEGVDPFYLQVVSQGIAQGRIQVQRPETVPTSLDEAFDDLWLELPGNRDYLVHRLLCTLAIMQDYGDDVMFADLFSRALPIGAEQLTPMEVASLRAQAGKLLVYRGDRYGLMHARLRNYLIGTQADCQFSLPGQADSTRL